MKLLLVIGASAMMLLSSCQTAPTNQIWLRTDGRSQVGNPHLMQQFEIDRTVCVGETQKSAVGAPVVYSDGSIGSTVSAAMVTGQKSDALNDVMKGCMAQKGYVMVPKDQAPAMAAQFRNNAGKK
ncbi:hypothetical protein ACTJK5_01450 [Agrobacterium sp. 22094]|uniref:hypothetical protein n=1 Tax=Agrobacterium sp. 22094 TaxID=3453872 RepID=UPI003F8553EB